MKWIKRLSWVVLFSIVAILVLLNVCIPFRTSDANTRSYFEKKSEQIQINYLDWKKGELRYVCTPYTDSLPVVLFVHGGPGSANNFYDYLSDSLLQTQAQLVAIDRPGYGYSDYGKAMPSLESQAQAVKVVMDQFPNRQIILVGHSYGGPIAGKVAAEYPDQVKGLLLIAPVIDPDNEKIFWFSPFSWWPLTRWLLPRDLKVAGVEKHTHAAELKKMVGDWSKIQGPVIHLHGEADFMAPASNIKFSRDHISKKILKQVVLPQAGHFIPWTNYKIVQTELLNLINQVTNEKASHLEWESISGK